MSPLLARLASACLLLAAVAASAGAQAATLVLLNGRVVTVDSAHPEAQAIAIAGSRILAVGTSAQMERHVLPATRVIDLRGQLVIPGFIEGHGHFMGLGESKLQLDLTRARTWEEIVSMVGDAARRAQPGTWIEGGGWHQEKWDRRPAPMVEGNPVHAALSAASPNNPVVLSHASGHGSMVNARALELAGIDRNTPDPVGGEIVRDAAGNATGLLRETAQRLVGRAQARTTAALSADERTAHARRLVNLAAAEALAKGVTSFHDAGSSFSTIDFLAQLADSGQLPIRLYVMVRGEPTARLDSLLPRYLMTGRGNGYLTVRSLKRQIDGALGSHGAWLLEPYADLPRSSGLALESPESLAQVAEIAVRHGFQVNTHAIGDRANRETLDVYERTFRAHPDKRDLRWRIEHAQHIAPADLPRFRDLGVIASMQGIHTVSDAPWIPGKLGPERAATESYLFRSLWDLGVVVTNGTDVPVEDIDPIASFHGMVARTTRDGTVFTPEQRLTREEALRAYTLNNAYASFQERELGSITPGKFADIVVLTRDIMRVPEAEIPEARVALTIVGGEIRYDAGASPAQTDASGRP